jgi:hypothetical protein
MKNRDSPPRILDIQMTHVKIQFMETNKKIKTIEPEAHSSYRKHRRQTFWQVLLPVLLSVLVVLAGLVLLIMLANGGDPAGKLSVWADTSLIWVLLPMLGLGLMIILILGAVIYLLARLLKILPTYTAIVQHYFKVAEAWVKALADKVTHPVVKARGYQAGAGHLLKSLFGLLHR